MMIEIVILSKLNLKCIKNIIFFFFINSNIFQGDVLWLRISCNIATSFVCL